MSTAARQSHAQSYIQNNKVGPLFEELMSSLIKDQPKEPLIHLMKVLQKKANAQGVSVPLSLKVGLEDDASEGRKPLRAAGLPQKHQGAPGSGPTGRSYEKPWLHNQRKPSKTAASYGEWNSDTKLEGDVRFSQHRAPGRSTSQDRLSSRPSDAAVFMWSAQSDVVHPPAAADFQDDSDPLDSEFKMTRTQEQQRPSSPVPASGGKKLLMKSSCKQQHRLELLQAIEESKKKSQPSSSPKDSGISDEEEEEKGVYLMEDEDVLASEGARLKQKRGSCRRAVSQVVQPPAEPEVRMVFCGRCARFINEEAELAHTAPQTSMYARTSSNSSEEKQQVVFGRKDSDEFPATARSNFTADFESASQVVGPRHPVWDVDEHKSRVSTGSYRSVTRHKTRITKTRDEDTPSPESENGKGKGWVIVKDVSDDETESDFYGGRDVRKY